MYLSQEDLNWPFCFLNGTQGLLPEGRAQGSCDLPASLLLMLTVLWGPVQMPWSLRREWRGVHYPDPRIFLRVSKIGSELGILDSKSYLATSPGEPLLLWAPIRPSETWENSNSCFFVKTLVLLRGALNNEKKKIVKTMKSFVVSDKKCM